MSQNEFEQQYKRLNSAQKKAVDTIEGPVMVIAGPGTGKTTILTLRIANILKKTDTPPDGILALTFTDSGAKAMQERLIGTIGKAAYYVRISTFHSFCSAVIQEFPDKFPLTSNAEPLSDLERVEIFQQILSVVLESTFLALLLLQPLGLITPFLLLLEWENQHEILFCYHHAAQHDRG